MHMGSVRYWERENSIEALQAFFSKEGRAPKLHELRAENGLPARGSLYGTTGQPFKRYSEALAAAGIETPRTGGALPTPTRHYVVFEWDGETTYTQIGTCEAKTQDDAIIAVAETEGEYAAVPISALATRELARRLTVVRTEDGFLREQAERRVVEV